MFFSQTTVVLKTTVVWEKPDFIPKTFGAPVDIVVQYHRPWGAYPPAGGSVWEEVMMKFKEIDESYWK